MKKFSSAPIRIPVRLANGKWECVYGAEVPLRDGAVGELLIEKSAISDERFFDSLQRIEHKILGRWTTLLVALSLPPHAELDARLLRYLVAPGSVKWSGDYYDVLRSRSPHIAFVEVQVGEPTAWQAERARYQDGGVWLVVEGMQPKGIITSQILIPPVVSEEPLNSLNHAFTRLSEMYEPWRKSHTGNIYERVFYQEADGRWYPLNILRDAALARHRQEFGEAEAARKQRALRSQVSSAEK